MFSAGGLGHGNKEHQPMPVVIDYFYDNVHLFVSVVPLINRVLKSKILQVVVTSWQLFPKMETYTLGVEVNM